MITMHKIIVFSGRNAGKERAQCRRSIKVDDLVPTNVRNPLIVVGWLKPLDLTFHPTQTWRVLTFEARLGQKLHSEANTQEWNLLVEDLVFQDCIKRT